MEEHEGRGEDRAQRAAASAVGALVGLAVEGPAGAVVGATSGPLLEPIMARVWDELRADTRVRAAVVAQTAADALGDDASAFEQRVGASEQTRFLAATAMDAGMRTVWHPKLHALGQALANGLAHGDAEVDDEPLIIGALGVIEAPHARVLELLLTKKCEFGPRGNRPRGPRWVAVKIADKESPPRRYPEWEAEQIASVLTKLSGAVPTVLGTMQRHGLVAPRYDLSDVLGNIVAENNDGTFEIDTSGPSEPDIKWSATHLGHRLYELLREAIEEDEATRTPVGLGN